MESANERDLEIERASRDASASAATQLAELRRLQRPEEGLAPSRGYAALMLVIAVVMTAYVTLFLFAYDGFGPGEGNHTYPASMLLLAPVICLAGLSNGARERFGVRVREARTTIGLWVVFLAGFLALGVLKYVGSGYPDWFNIVVPICVFLLMGARPLRQLLSGGTRANEEWQPAQLAAPARVTTVVIGVVLAALLIASSLKFAAAIIGLIVFLAFLAMMIAWRTRFGLPAVGLDWGSRQWGCFIGATAVAFVSSLSVVNGASWGWPVACGAAAIVVLVMVIAAFLPTTVRR
ncbi:hypothetical protein ACIFOC_01734 [Leucobacter aridicollis]|uniref:hypothetical protein n=1 Tax=Leucobacter aridicollis TaxID=283878 RepID=UPI0037C4FC96